MHNCNWPGCSINVPTNIYCCGPHWYKIPSIFRHNINRAWSSRDLDAWTLAHDAAQDWIKANTCDTGTR